MLDGLVEKVPKIGFLSLWGAIGCGVETGGFLIGESVVKIDACGGGSDIFILLP